MKFLDLAFSSFRVYRRLRGGVWRQLRFKPLPYLVGWFRNQEPRENEFVESIEDYR